MIMMTDTSYALPTTTTTVPTTTNAAADGSAHKVESWLTHIDVKPFVPPECEAALNFFTHVKEAWEQNNTNNNNNIIMNSNSNNHININNKNIIEGSSSSTAPTSSVKSDECLLLASLQPCSCCDAQVEWGTALAAACCMETTVESLVDRDGLHLVSARPSFEMGLTLSYPSSRAASSLF